MIEDDYDYYLGHFVHDNKLTLNKTRTPHLSSEVGNANGGLVLAIGGDVATPDVLDGDVLDVEADVVAGSRLRQRLVVHLNRLHLRKMRAKIERCVLSLFFVCKISSLKHDNPILSHTLDFSDSLPVSTQ
jgi:hypothetical protein